MQKLLHILILEDYESDALLLLRELRRGGFDPEYVIVDNANDMRHALSERHWDIILSDYSMPGFDAINALKILQESGKDIPFIIVSGTIGEDVAVKVMKTGAADFFAKDKLARLVPAVRREVRDAQERQGRRTAEHMAQATLDALSAHIAILDESGKILSVNQAWVDFARENDAHDSVNAYTDWNYLVVCDNVTGPDQETAKMVSSCIRDVLAGRKDVCEVNYPCHSPTEARWFTVRVSRFRGDGPVRVVVAHENITDQKYARDAEHTRRVFAEALNSTTSMLFSDNFDREHVLDVILDYASKLIPCDAATLMEVKSGIAHVIGTTGYTGEDLEDILNFTMIVDRTNNLQQMVETRKPFLVEDTSKFIGWNTEKISKLAEIRSMLGAPIFIGDQLWGFINLDSFVPDHFTERHTDQLALLCNQAAIAIYNAQQYEQKRQYAKRLELLHQIDMAILRADQPKDITSAVLNELHALAGFHSSTVTLFDQEKSKQTILASTASDMTRYQSGVSYKLDHPELIAALENNMIYVIDDLLRKQSLTSFEEELVSTNIRSYASFPLMVDGKLLGSLNLRSEQIHAFSTTELNIANEVAIQLAIALENARLLELEQRRNGELTALHQASLHLTSTLELESVLDIILDYAVLLVNANVAHIYLSDGEKLTFGAAHWDGIKHKKPLVEPRQDGLTYTVAQTGERLFVPDLRDHPVYHHTQAEGSMICLPLKVKGEVKGVMSLIFSELHYSDENEIRLLELLADQAAIGIYNARLYQQIQSHATELEQRVIERTQQLQRAKDRAEAILNSSNDALILAGMNGKIYQTNPGFNSQFQCEPDALFGQSLSSLIKPESLDAFYRAVQEVIEERTSTRLEVVAVRQDGTMFPADVLISSIAEDGGSGILCSLRDMTFQKQVEADLREALKKEKEVSDLKSQFTSIVSHEFRTPLAVILSTADLLFNYHDRIPLERRLTKLKTITQQVQRLTRLMEDVLMFNRSETVGFEFKPTPLNAVALCDRIISEFQLQHENKVMINFIHDDACHEVNLDEFLFDHILQNLVSNAIKYSKKDGEVQIQLDCSDNELTLRIIDQGLGIPLEHQANLFESFQRASNVGNIQGTGIGMTIVKRAVDAHGGTIEFESEEGQGTTFIVKLPIKQMNKSE